MFKISELAGITGSRLVSGDGETAVTSVTVDSRNARPGALFVALDGANHDGASFAADAESRQAVAVLCRDSKKIELPLARCAVLEHPDPVAALGVLAAAHRQRLRARVIGITGSTGKTTTKELLHWILSWSHAGKSAHASFNNAIGVPLTLLGAADDDEFVVCEIGTNAPGEIAALSAIVQPDIAVVTCVGPTHLEGLGSVDEVGIEKAALIAALRPGGVALLNASDPRVAAMRAPEGVRVVRFALAAADGSIPDAEIRGRVVESGLDGLLMEVERHEGALRIHVPLLGRHNAQNVLAALAVASVVDASALMPMDWRSFKSPPMRMQIVPGAGVVYLNDAYNANPLSMGAALATLAELPAGERIAVLGEMMELGPLTRDFHRQIGRDAALLPLAGIVTVGAIAGEIARGAREAGFDPQKIRETKDVGGARTALEELVALAGDGGPQGRIVLLKASRAAGLERLIG